MGREGRSRHLRRVGGRLEEGLLDWEPGAGHGPSVSWG